MSADIINCQVGKKSLAWKKFRRRFRDNRDRFMLKDNPVLFIEEACNITLEQWQYLALFDMTKMKV